MSFGGPNQQPWQRNVMPFQNMVPQNVYNMPAFANNNNAVPLNPYGGNVSNVNVVSYPQTYNSIGTITKINNECGLVNDEVFFYRHVCKGQVPKLGDRVLFEATSASSPTSRFKWNASRIQLMPPQPLMSTPISGSGISDHKSSSSRFGNDYRDHNSPVHDRRSSPVGRERRDDRSFREREQVRERERERERERDREQRERVRERAQRSREREDLERDRKRRREDLDHSRERERVEAPRAVVPRKPREGRKDQHSSPERNDKDRKIHERERKSPKVFHRPGYIFAIPKQLTIYNSMSAYELSQRYPSMYIPSNLFEVKTRWHEAFTLEKPFSLHRACQFHIVHPTVEPLTPHKKEHLEPSDEDYAYSAKVMLLSCPSLAEIYRDCCESDKENLSRVLRFLVGSRGANDLPMLIGGTWSPSLDGLNPDKDPAVLIRTAIRTTKALTGIDLSNCTQWYRFCELRYISPKNSQVETVVIYLPDIHSCMPTADEWQKLRDEYKAEAERIIARREKRYAAINNTKRHSSCEAAEASEPSTKKVAVAEKKADSSKPAAGGSGDGDDAETQPVMKIEPAEEQPDNDVADEQNTSTASSTAAAGEGATSEAETQNTVGDSIDDNEKEKEKPTHHSKLDLKTMKVMEIRNELAARNLPSKGARNVLVTRLAKALNTEKAEEQKEKAKTDAEKKSAPKEAEISNNAETIEKSEDESKTNLENNEIKTEATEAIDENNENSKENEEQDEWNEGGVDVDMNDIVILDEYDSRKNPEDPKTPKEMTEKERKQLRARYTLPDSPHIIVHPNRAAKKGKFNCFVSPLKKFCLYYHSDFRKTNLTLELSLFAEFFKEMLSRDLAFDIYKELYIHVESKAKDDGKSATIKDENKANNDKNEDKTSKDTSNTDTKSEDGRQSSKSASKHREHREHNDKKKNMVVVKPHLLLSFTHFDINHCGYVVMKDLSKLLSMIGLSLSRGQLEAFLEKVTTRQTFDYRTLTDKEVTADSIPTIEDASNIDSELIKKIALGNLALEKQFENTSTSNEDNATDAENGLVNYNGTVVHVGKLMEQIQRTEKTFADLEKLHHDLRRQHTDLQKDQSRANHKIKDLSSDVKSLTRKLADADNDLYRLNRENREQMDAMRTIYRRLEPFVGREKEKSKDKKNEKDKKVEKKEEKDKEHKTEANNRTEKEKKEQKDQVNEKEKEKGHTKKEKLDQSLKKHNSNGSNGEDNSTNNKSEIGDEAMENEEEHAEDEAPVGIKTEITADTDVETSMNAEISNNGDEQDENNEHFEYDENDEINEDDEMNEDEENQDENEEN